jgi:hypothetical protein
MHGFDWSQHSRDYSWHECTEWLGLFWFGYIIRIGFKSIGNKYYNVHFVGGIDNIKRCCDFYGGGVLMISTSQRWGMCDVCRLVDYNTDSKECVYCPLCDAWICKTCLPNWSRRIKAAIKRQLEPGFVGQANYVDLIESQLKEQSNERARTNH